MTVNAFSRTEEGEKYGHRDRSGGDVGKGSHPLREQAGGQIARRDLRAGACRTDGARPRRTRLKDGGEGGQEHERHPGDRHRVARRRGQTLAEMALAWLLKDNLVTSVIVGVSSVEQLDDNFKALRNTAFSVEEQDEIEKILTSVAK